MPACGHAGNLQPVGSMRPRWQPHRSDVCLSVRSFIFLLFPKSQTQNFENEWTHFDAKQWGVGRSKVTDGFGGLVEASFVAGFYASARPDWQEA